MYLPVLSIRPLVFACLGLQATGSIPKGLQIQVKPGLNLTPFRVWEMTSDLSLSQRMVRGHP